MPIQLNEAGRPIVVDDRAVVRIEHLAGFQALGVGVDRLLVLLLIEQGIADILGFLGLLQLLDKPIHHLVTGNLRQKGLELEANGVALKDRGFRVALPLRGANILQLLEGLDHLGLVIQEEKTLRLQPQVGFFVPH